jgi:RNA polymerase primary sigma factor
MKKTSLDIYLSEIRNNILTPEKESELIHIYKNRLNGWEEAQESIIKSNLLFVVKTAFEFSRDSRRTSELISEGNVSLMESLDKFDETKGCRFLTYAAFDVRGRMIKYLTKNNYFSALKISLKNVELANKAKAFIKNYNLENNINPSISEIAKHCQIEESKALLIAELAQISIYAVQITFVDDEENEKLHEIKDEINAQPDEEVNQNDVSSILLKIVSELPLKQRIVINKRFGLNGESPTDLHTIGEELNLTKERIRQIESSVLKTIRKELEKMENKSAYL